METDLNKSEERLREDKMNVVRICSAAAAVLLGMGAVSGAAQAQAGNYPARAVTIIADAPPGSTPDVDARFVAEGLGKMWGRQVIVIEHPGGFGSIAARAAADAAPDGYTLYMPALATFVAPKTAAPNVPLQLPRDFIPIGFTAENPMFVAVNPSLGVSTLPELIALAKKKPGSISIAVSGAGRLTDLTGRLLQQHRGRGRRRRHRTRVDDHRGLFGHRRRGQRQANQADRGRFVEAPAGIPRRSADRRHGAGIFRNRMASSRCAEGHAAADRQQGQRRFSQAGQQPGLSEAPRHHRQLFARHDA
jgi:hypothetical protein